jgi:hypothetical protein
MEYRHLSHANRRRYNRAITHHHRRRIELEILNLDGKIIRTLTPKILSGTITTDVEQAPLQVADLTFVDRRGTIVFEPDSSGDAPIHRKFLVQINDSRFIPGIGWVDCYVFGGPIWDFDRTGLEVKIVAHSVDRLAMGTVRKAKQWLRKTKKTTVIKELLRAAGATLLRIPDLRFTTPVHVHVGVTHPKKKGEKPHKVRRRTGFEVNNQNTYWDKASALGESMNRLLFPTPDLGFELRSAPERPVYHFNRALLTDPEQHRPIDEGPNTFVVIGAKPKGSKRRVSSGKVGFPKGHPLSASELAWGPAGDKKPYEILEKTQNPHFKTKKECRKVAIRKRDRAARTLTEVSFDALPIPWLRPWDLVTAEAKWGVPGVHIKQLTYPLSADGSAMTVGAIKRTRSGR